MSPTPRRLSVPRCIPSFSGTPLAHRIPRRRTGRAPGEPLQKQPASQTTPDETGERSETLATNPISLAHDDVVETDPRLAELSSLPPTPVSDYVWTALASIAVFGGFLLVAFLTGYASWTPAIVTGR